MYRTPIAVPIVVYRRQHFKTHVDQNNENTSLP